MPGSMKYRLSIVGLNQTRTRGSMPPGDPAAVPEARVSVVGTAFFSAVLTVPLSEPSCAESANAQTIVASEPPKREADSRRTIGPCSLGVGNSGEESECSGRRIVSIITPFDAGSLEREACHFQNSWLPEGMKLRYFAQHQDSA